MADTIPDLWGEEIDVADLSPAIILDGQAEKLQQRTNRLITAQIWKRSLSAYDELLFDITSGANNHRSRLLVCRHAKEEGYPAWISSLGLKPTIASVSTTPFAAIFQPTTRQILPSWLKLDPTEIECTEAAHNQHDFVETLRKVFSSGYVKAKIASSVARANEASHVLTHIKDDPFYEPATEA